MNKEVTVLIYEFMSILSCYPQFTAVSAVCNLTRWLRWLLLQPRL